MLREALKGFEATMPDHWMVSATRTYVGDCVTDLARYEESERLITQGYGDMARSLGPGHARTMKAARYAARLYKTWAKQDQAAEWEAKTKAP